ncbi:hypothetical protein POM88_000082 [Heracleum sosnowskyi]|uniref:Uncharacterized protein n=1 Tax=Heracleum sosnowskyi TaxID=360622 RepID=A0AAD8J9Z9_9APIA|nr:hypothetical protein POM88_000082 [Heracleum sosnowskyi]
MASSSSILDAMNNVTLEDEEERILDFEDEGANKNNQVRPYGVWMRAPFRNQVKPIGAKWLRSGGEEAPWNMGEGGERMNSVTEGNNQDPKFPQQTMHAGTAGGVSGGKIQTTTDVVNLGIRGGTWN